MLHSNETSAFFSLIIALSIWHGTISALVRTEHCKYFELLFYDCKRECFACCVKKSAAQLKNCITEACHFICNCLISLFTAMTAHFYCMPKEKLLFMCLYL
uniref:Secreted protein n=1 Tax=Rhipicephalus microplus TaxID=6941 RepID=A0A6G5AID6_RHIMP